MSDSDEEFHDHEVAANINTERACTDIPCCLVFVVYCVGMGVVTSYAFANGDLRKAHHMYDFNGKLCGVDDPVKDKPLAYYCLQTGGTPTTLSLEFPVCVAACPVAGAGAQEGCPLIQTNTLDPNLPAAGIAAPTYPTTVFAQKICMPAQDELKKQFMSSMDQIGGFEKLMNVVDSIGNGWPIITGTVIVAFLAGFLFLFFLRKCVGPLVYLMILITIVGSLGAGSYFVYRANDALDDSAAAHDKEGMANSRTMQLYLGYGLLAFGGLFTFMTLCCCRKSIAVAIAVVGESTNVIFEMPAMLLQPTFEFIVKALGSLLLVYGLLYLLTCGTMKSETFSAGTLKVAGIKRSVEFDDQQKWMLAYYILGVFWYQELVTAIGLFCIAYATVAWYFTPKDSNGHKDVAGIPMLTGLQYSFTYHLGSLAFGSFIIAFCRFVQFVLGMLAKQAHQEGNAVMEALAKILACIIECFKRTMEFLNKNAYIDIAIHSNSFCHAAWEAFTKIVTNAGKYGFLNGATEIIKVIGLFVITLEGILFSFALTKIGTFNDTTSSYYLENPYAVIGLCGILSAVIAYSFMMIFDMVSDTLLYCFVDSTDKKSAEDYCPESLLHLMNDDHDNSCC